MRRPSRSHELGVQLETERETPSTEAREGPRKSPRGQSHHTVRDRDPVRICSLHSHPRLVPEPSELRNREALAAMAIRMVRRSCGSVVVQEFRMQALVDEGRGELVYRGSRKEPQHSICEGFRVGRGHEKPSGRPEDAADLEEHLRGVVDVLEDLRRDDRVERFVVEWQGFRVGQDDPDPIGGPRTPTGPPPPPGGHALREEVHPDDVEAPTLREGQGQSPLTAPEVEEPRGGPPPNPEGVPPQEPPPG